MSTTDLFNFLSVLHPLSEEFKESLNKELVLLSFPKNHLLLTAPNIAEYVYFIQSGFAMSFSFDEDKRMIEAFWKSGQLMTSPSSFYEQTPATESIQLLEKSALLCLSHSSLLHLFNTHDETHYLYHKIMNRHFAKCRLRIHDLQRLSASERFENLLDAFPEIEQYAAQDNIASFLGITPQSLSRLKREKK